MSGCAGKYSHGNFENKMFSKYDNDQSGYVEKDEYIAIAVARFDRSDDNEDGKLEKEELKKNRFVKMMPNFVDNYFKTYDLNKDGIVLKQELKEQSSKEFIKADLNKDQKLSKSEIKDFRMENRFNSIDLNKDNMISKEEYKNQQIPLENKG